MCITQIHVPKHTNEFTLVIGDDDTALESEFLKRPISHDKIILDTLRVGAKWLPNSHKTRSWGDFQDDFLSRAR